MNVVLDTNVLVSGLLNPHGTPGEIVRLLSSGMLTLYYDTRIFSEYREVLARPRFQFDHNHIQALLDLIQALGEIIVAPPLPKPLPDPKDEAFLAVACAAQAKYLITGNLKHFPESYSQHVSVVSPTEFINHFRTHTK